MPCPYCKLKPIWQDGKLSYPCGCAINACPLYLANEAIRELENQPALMLGREPRSIDKIMQDLTRLR